MLPNQYEVPTFKNAKQLSFTFGSGQFQESLPAELSVSPVNTEKDKKFDTKIFSPVTDAPWLYGNDVSLVTCKAGTYPSIEDLPRFAKVLPQKEPDCRPWISWCP